MRRLRRQHGGTGEASARLLLRFCYRKLLMGRVLDRAFKKKDPWHISSMQGRRRACQRQRQALVHGLTMLAVPLNHTSTCKCP